MNTFEIFRIFDVDNNGVISKSELVKLVKDMSGLMSRTGTEKGLSVDELVESSWREMDTDRDNSITMDEFITSVLRHDKFSKLLAIKVLDMFT